MAESATEPSSVLATLFRHNCWANLKLLDACAGLSPEQLDAAAVGGFGSIRDTLRHTVEAEISYVERVTGALPPQEDAADFDRWRAGVQWAAAELLKLALMARADTQVRQRPPRQAFVYPLASLIAQALSHSTEHRTQVTTVLTQLGIKPPDLSGWAYMEEHGQLHEGGADS